MNPPPLDSTPQPPPAAPTTTVVEKPKRKKKFIPPPTFHPYTCLGYDHGNFYYLSHAGRQVIALTGTSHTIGNLVQLADLSYWKAMYNTEGRVPVDKAANYLIAQCHKAGIYDPAKIRGRGAWWDDGRSVMHAGDRLIVDGQWTEIPAFKTKYIYEASKPIDIDVSNPLTAVEASRFGVFLGKLSWAEPTAARLASGWCVCALIAGALQWHPHLWIAAKAGSGKTWVMDKVVSEILLGFAQEFKSSVTTEPGIRRSLMGSSLPVMLDDPDGAAQIDKIIELMRACSQSGRAKAAQGGGEGGSAVHFELLSSFICSSVVISFTNEADIGRITVLTLDNTHQTMQEQEKLFTQLKIDRAELLTESYCRRFQARAVAMIPTIRASIEPMVIAASRVLGNRRGGDQIGTLLAGAWSLRSDKPPTLAEAIAWIGEKDLSDEIEARRESDEIVCMRTIAQAVLNLDHGIRRRVDELLRAACAPEPAGGPLGEDEIEAEKYRRAAIATLRRHGILPQPPDAVAISNTDEAIKRMLRGTPWEKNWSSTLVRIPHSQRLEPVWFARSGAGSSKARSVAIPIGTFLGETEREPGED